jgi:alpha-mannosidase
LDVESPVATYETPYGHIVRESNGNEEPGQRWINVTGKLNGNDYGLTVINDAKYGYSVKGNDLRISVIRSAVYAHHNPKVLDLKQEYHWMDQGIHTFRMLLVPQKGTWKEGNIVRTAEEFSAPPLVIYQGIHGGTFPKANSFLSADVPNVVLSVVKHSEDRNDRIIRCVESQGLSTAATLNLGFAGRTWKGQFHPFEIKTLRLNPSTGSIREVNLLEE